MRFLAIVLAFLIACEDSAPSPSGGLININTATVAELERLPAIGAKRARSIIAARNARGGQFTSLAEIESIDGIGPGTMNELRVRVYLGPPNPSR